ncbi:hypothetical protein DEJ50_05205 [Streptomyces venezuelae]|uniref:Uncharacterized protein n=1 Tax=Streptomyces venezuelae TaxID=54571 RepID=A0A5P2CWN1_STRVZ|nr:ImmA/IrrE family metallo-endopeptidase [Streptomyces venezuelae]QES47314.1 hypothetical protein DEJ50_05205 [Streptomyces venezuelae]
MPFRHLKLRRRCQTILGHLDLTEPFSVDALCARMAEQRGRPILLHPLPREAAESGICGLWVGTDSTDFVFYEAQTSPLHREHIVLHELGHILFGHNALADMDPAADLQENPEAVVPRVLGRTNYTTRQEQEAEMLASMIRARAGLHPAGRSPGGTLERLETAMGVR